MSSTRIDIDKTVAMAMAMATETVVISPMVRSNAASWVHDFTNS